jgi:hypothetical protein
MLQEAGMSKGFWPEAHQYSNHVRNRSPTSALTRTTPYKVFYKKKPDISTLRVFGSRCHVRIPKSKRGKLDAHSLDGILCGFAHRSKAYKVWIPSLHKFKTSRDVVVYEKLPEHEEEPIITSASGEGVTQDESASSEGFTKAPAIIETSQPPAEPPPTLPEIPPTTSKISNPTQPAPTQSISANIPAPPPSQDRLGSKLPPMHKSHAKSRPKQPLRQYMMLALSDENSKLERKPKLSLKTCSHISLLMNRKLLISCTWPLTDRIHHSAITML